MRDAAARIASGDISNSKDWTNLASKLNAKGYAVLMFDFRGYGDSTTVQPGTATPKDLTGQTRGFWHETLNQRGIKGVNLAKQLPTEIKQESFCPNIIPCWPTTLPRPRLFWTSSRIAIRPI